MSIDTGKAFDQDYDEIEEPNFLMEETADLFLIGPTTF